MLGPGLSRKKTYPSILIINPTPLPTPSMYYYCHQCGSHLNDQQKTEYTAQRHPPRSVRRPHEYQRRRRKYESRRAEGESRRAEGESRRVEGEARREEGEARRDHGELRRDHDTRRHHESHGAQQHNAEEYDDNAGTATDLDGLTGKLGREMLFDE